MTRTVFCEYLQQESVGLEFQTIPGELGKKIYNSISQEAWSAWLTKQTMLINEKKLNLAELDTRVLLEQEMINFLFEGKEIEIIGYVSPTKTK